MTLYGMDAAMMAGVLSAVTVFVTQNMTYIDPVRGTMSAETLRSDERNRSHKARALLDSPSTGRSRILVIQLQGHLFFGNIAGLSKKVHDLMSERFGTINQPVIVILDFSLVLGIDSSAAQAVVKFKTVMRKQFDVTLSIFVSGSPNGFPCAFDLSTELAAALSTRSRNTDLTGESTGLLHRVSSHDAVEALIYSGSHVSDDLNLALIYAENSLIARQNSDLLVDDVTIGYKLLRKSSSLSEEREVAEKYLLNLCPSDADERNARNLFSKFRREVYVRGDYLWKQGSPSLSIKLLVRGILISILENEAGTNETISVGNTIGELGVIEGVARMSSVSCCSEEAVVYSLSLEAYHKLQKSSPQASRLVDLICIRYLSARVQHVSNRIFETRCLPI
jgi:SulP family sulfate permease